MLVEPLVETPRTGDLFLPRCPLDVMLSGASLSLGRPCWLIQFSNLIVGFVAIAWFILFEQVTHARCHPRSRVRVVFICHPDIGVTQSAAGCVDAVNGIISAWFREYKKAQPAKQPTGEQVLAIQEFLKEQREAE